VVITNFIADDLPKELKRLRAAVEAMRSDLDVLLERGELPDGGEHREVLEAYRMFADDRGWLHRLEEAVRTGLTAEAAVERVQSDTRARMLRISDPYLRDRLHDLDDLANRLMHQLLGQDYAPARDRLPENAVLVARSMGPAALLEYDRRRLRGLILEEGGPNSHVAIVARALGIAAVGEIANATGICDPGDALIVDGTTGDVHVRPTPDMEAAYAERVRLRARRQSQYLALRDKPCVTKCGEPITLMINAGLAVDLPHIEETGAAGVGLFRTELQFMVAATFPRAAEQFSLYRAVLDAAGERPVTFRTLDIGGDKILPYMRSVVEENPALGWRAIRLGLDRPALLRSQIRALLRAAAGRGLKIMFPMIAAVAEFDEAKALVERELTHLRRHGHRLPERVDVGSMVEVPSLLYQLDELVEVPSLLYQLDELLDRADFLSVGSNDLVQFFYAADRGNARVADRFDPISVPVLRALKEISVKGLAYNKPVAVCGELASRPIGALALVAIGYRSFSLSPSAVGPVKAMLLDLDIPKIAALVEPLLESPAGSVSVRDQLKEFAAVQGLAL
jgi:phosphotransferase system enzyme I (PtsP)